MQAVVASQWTGYALAAFDDLAAGGGAQRVGRGASRTVLQAAPAAPAIYATASPAYYVVANWEAARELPADAAGARASAVLPPGGCLAYGSAGDVVGGFVVEYNGRRATSRSCPRCCPRCTPCSRTRMAKTAMRNDARS
jgi:hypothetical protein